MRAIVGQSWDVSGNDYVHSISSVHAISIVAQHKRFLAIFNATGQPAKGFPLGSFADGRPIGVQFVGPFGDESTLFRIAGQLERAQLWTGRAPT